MTLDEFCGKLDDALAASPNVEESLETAVKAICMAFSVKPDEVAMLLLDEGAETLSFLWPVALKNSGTVPLSATYPLVARTARENRACFNNTFETAPHASFFEKFRTTTTKSLPIQKIMSAPLSAEGMVKGVVQVSRKGEDAGSAGSDFSSDDLLVLERVASVIAGRI